MHVRVCVRVAVRASDAGPWASGLFCGSPSVSSRAVLYQSRPWQDRRRLINHTFSRCRCTSAPLLHRSAGWPLSINKRLHSIQTLGEAPHAGTHTHTHACMQATIQMQSYGSHYLELLRNWLPTFCSRFDATLVYVLHTSVLHLYDKSVLTQWLHFGIFLK